MSKLVRRRWETASASGCPVGIVPRATTRRTSRTRSVGRPVRLDGDVAADVADAEAAVDALRRQGGGARRHRGARAAAAAGRVRRVVEDRGPRGRWAAAAPRRGGIRARRGHQRRDCNRGARQHRGDGVGARWRGRGDAITVDHLLEAHRRLLDGTRLPTTAGRIRDEQNWIGGSSYNPCSASFVPPPPSRCNELLEDLCAFCNGETCRPSSRRRWRTPSSRRSTRSSTATGASDGR